MAARSSAAATPPSPTPDTLSDPIDWARHFWRQHGVDGNEQRFLVMTSFLRYHRIVVEAVERALHLHGLNLTDYLLMMTLELSESGTRLISSLARNLMVHPTTATLATDRLENRGLLFRSPHPTDRRAICVTITDEGRALVLQATVALDAVDFGFVNGSKSNVDKLGSLLSILRGAAGDAQPSTPRSIDVDGSRDGGSTPAK